MYPPRYFSLGLFLSKSILKNERSDLKLLVHLDGAVALW
jgi:hypothetical protein